MKKTSALLFAATMLSTTAALADGGGFGATNISTSDCKWHSTRATDDEDGEWLEYSVERREDGLYLHVKHVNIFFNCATLGAECSVQLEGSVLTLEEHEKPGSEMADCICPYDVTYDVGPLAEGSYTVRLTMNGYKLAEFPVNIAAACRSRFDIKAYVTKVESALPSIPEDEAIYDLQGRRYATFPFPGIFIRGGKKVVHK